MTNIIFIILELYICVILTVEFFYDKTLHEKKNRRIKRSRDKVVIEVEDGQATIIEKPKDLDVLINQKGEK